ncbi:MAG: outer membrane protein assembly factor BamE [Fimbriimonadaceae bacterium]|nr:outer membrane protein assembly factor BamE [Fimbriimonadaceae bacterium]
MKARLRPIDWAFLIGGPLVFLAIAWFGLNAIIGPSPTPNPVEQLRAGRIKPGMSEAEVRAILGPPKADVTQEEGKFYYRYQRSAWQSETRTFTEEDAYVDFEVDGRVSGVSFESRTPPPAGADANSTGGR